MTFTERNATEEETATLKCNVLLDNHMQCNHKVAKIVTTDTPPENLINTTLNPGVFVAYCQAHYNINIQTLKLNETPKT